MFWGRVSLPQALPALGVLLARAYVFDSRKSPLACGLKFFEPRVLCLVQRGRCCGRPTACATLRHAASRASPPPRHWTPLRQQSSGRSPVALPPSLPRPPQQHHDVTAAIPQPLRRYSSLDTREFISWLSLSNSLGNQSLYHPAAVPALHLQACCEQSTTLPPSNRAECFLPTTAD